VGEPIRLANLSLSGVSAEAAKAGAHLKVWTRLALTSDDLTFHRIVGNLAAVIESHVQKAGKHIRINRAETILLVIKADDTAELWVDAAAVSLRCMVKRSMSAGSIVFENDIADITGMSFPCVNIEKNDKVLCLFRQDWRFALYFDFNPDGNLDLEGLTGTLGTLYRNLRYRHLYDALADEVVFSRLVQAGWFPFVEILPGEFRELLDCCEASFDLSEPEATLVAKFDDARLDQILKRWVARPHFLSKAPLLEAAVSAFKKKEPVAVIKILLTEIEGILNNAHKSANGRGAKIEDLLAFAVASAERKAGQRDTLLFPANFAKYLAAHTFANFNPVQEDGTAGSRHAVGHGAAQSDTYTMVRALQAILTMDQIAFFI